MGGDPNDPYKSWDDPPNILPETNIAHENLSFPSKYHQNGGFSMAMLVYRSVGFVIFSIPISLGHLQVDPGTQKNTEPMEPTPDDSIRNQVRGVVRC